MCLNCLMYLKTKWRFLKNLNFERFFPLFLHKTDILIEDTISRPNTGSGGKNSFKNCKLTKLQRHKCASAARPGPAEAPSPQRGFPDLFPPARVLPLPRRLSQPFPPFASPLTARRRLSSASLRFLQPVPCSSKSMIVYSFSKGRIPRGQRRGFLGVPRRAGRSVGGRAWSVPHNSAPTLLLVKQSGM